MSLSRSEPARPWPADRVERWPIERLIPYANNPRLRSEADPDRIAASILQFGWTIPPLVDEEGNLIAGQGRLGAGIRLRLTEIPVIVARGWSEEEKQAYRLADNQLAARANWDSDLLRNELQQLQFVGFDLRLIGFDPDPLQTIRGGFALSFRPSFAVTVRVGGGHRRLGTSDNLRLAADLQRIPRRLPETSWPTIDRTGSVAYLFLWRLAFSAN
jgi:hypothetical protein